MSCPKKEQDVFCMLVALTSNFAAQIESASRCVNERNAIPVKSASIKIFETSDLTNLSTKSQARALPPIDPSPIFFAVSAFSENRSMSSSLS